MAQRNHISTFPDAASLPMAFTWSCISLSVMAKTGWQNEKQRTAAMQTESMIRLNFFIFCIIILISALLFAHKRLCGKQRADTNRRVKNNFSH